MDLEEVLGTPNRYVDLGVPVPVGWAGDVSGEFSGSSTPREWPFTVDVTEISPGATSAWGREEGRAVVRQFFRSFAELFDGGMEFVSYPQWSGRNRTGERYEVIYEGPEVEI